jgi:ATP-binding cassette subfamily F protein 3
MTGSLPPLSGRVDFGHNVKPGYFQQGNIDLDDDDTITVLDAMLDVSDMTFEEARGFLGRFLFSGDDVFKSVGALSGGERGRLSVARLLISNPNLLVLDEPTTHLDIPSREALEQALSGYTGTLIFVSHDRRLISRLANALWMVENGTIMPFEGTFEEWTERQRAAEQGSERARKAPQRRRIPDQKAPLAKAEPEIDHEAVIAALEAKLTRIESNLQRATQKQDIAKITSLGEAYVGVRQELEAAWQAWSG